MKGYSLAWRCHIVFVIVIIPLQKKNIVQWTLRFEEVQFNSEMCKIDLNER